MEPPDFFDAVYQYPGGWLSDHLGRRRAFLILWRCLGGESRITCSVLHGRSSSLGLPW
jgi:nitrate/nitrite transporter NarK